MIAGAVIGGVVGVALIAAGTFWFLHRRRAQKAATLSLGTNDTKVDYPEYYQSTKPGSSGYFVPGSNASTRELDSVALVEVGGQRDDINGRVEMAQPVQLSELEAPQK